MLVNPPDDLVALVGPYLARNGTCRVISCRRKMGKLIVEFEAMQATSNGDGPETLVTRRYIGKVYRADRGQGHFDALTQLWGAGFCPPSPYTVVHPVAYIRERRLLLQEKAPGRLMADLIVGGPEHLANDLGRVGAWLATLHAAPLQAPSRIDEIRRLAELYGSSLAETLPQHAPHIRRLTERAYEALESRRLSALCPSHGDFHPKNVFIAPSGRVTVIDLDTFGAQEPAADVAYFMGQAAIQGHRHRGSFAATRQVRRQFLRAYLERTGDRLSPIRVAIYLGLCFLQSLYYELCILKTGNRAIVEPWLANSTRCLIDGRLSLLDEDIGAHQRAAALDDQAAVFDDQGEEIS